MTPVQKIGWAQQENRLCKTIYTGGSPISTACVNTCKFQLTIDGKTLSLARSKHCGMRLYTTKYKRITVNQLNFVMHMRKQLSAHEKETGASALQQILNR